jgi:hypothetical protein
MPSESQSSKYACALLFLALPLPDPPPHFVAIAAPAWHEERPDIGPDNGAAAGGALAIAPTAGASPLDPGGAAGVVIAARVAGSVAPRMGGPGTGGVTVPAAKA